MSSEPLLRGRRPSGRDRLLGFGFVAAMAVTGLVSGLNAVHPGPPPSAAPERVVLVPTAVAMAQPLPSRPVPIGLDTPAAQAVADRAWPPVSHPIAAHPPRATTQVAEEEAPPTALSVDDATADVSAIEPVAPPAADALITPGDLPRPR